MRFNDRADAGRKLAKVLLHYRGMDAIVYALPRGGVPLGIEVAHMLKLPIDLINPRKIGHPENPEYAIGAVAENGELACNNEEIARVDQTWFKQQVQLARKESRRRRDKYLEGRDHYDCAGKLAIIVDDGIATGLTMMAAIRDAKSRGAVQIVVAAPVISAATAERLRHEADAVIALEIPKFFFGAVSSYYDNFPQLSDEQVISLLHNQPQKI